MGSKERRLAHKEVLKQEIISAARSLFKEEGSWQGVTIRKIADAINYSLPTIYEYFENKEDLLKELQREGYATLCALIKNRVESASPEPVTLLTAVNQAYWDFAWSHPELYYIMHDQRMNPEDHKESIMFIRSTVDIALQNLAIKEEKTFSPEELSETLDTTRAIIHGFIMLSLADRMKKEKAYHLMMKTLEKMIQIKGNTHAE